jgi:hypothetical protein
MCGEAVSPPARRQLLWLIQSTMVVLIRVGLSYMGRWPTSGSTRTVTLGISSRSVDLVPTAIFSSLVSPSKFSSANCATCQQIFRLSLFGQTDHVGAFHP